MKNKILEATRKIFNPEFINRLDEIIVFRQLNREDLMQVIDILLKDLYSRLEAQKFEFEITTEAKELILENGYDPTLGARPLKRAIQRFLENPLSEKLLSGAIRKNEKLIISVDSDKKNLVFKSGEKAVP